MYSHWEPGVGDGRGGDTVKFRRVDLVGEEERLQKGKALWEELNPGQTKP